MAATIIGARLGENEHRADNLTVFDIALDAEDRAAIAAATEAMDAIAGDCGDEYRKPPFLTASGDLSHHLDALPPVFPVSPAPARPARMRALSGSIWEKKAGFSRAIRIGDRILISGTHCHRPTRQPRLPWRCRSQTVYILDKILAPSPRWAASPKTSCAPASNWLTPASGSRCLPCMHAISGTFCPPNTLVAVGGLIGPYAVEIEAEAIVDPAP